MQQQDQQSQSLTPGQKKSIFSFKTLDLSRQSINFITELRQIYIANYTNSIAQKIKNIYSKSSYPPDIDPEKMVEVNPERFDQVMLTNIMLKYNHIFNSTKGTISKNHFVSNFTFFDSNSSSGLVERIYDVLTKVQNKFIDIHCNGMSNKGFSLGMDEMNINTFLDYFEIINMGSLKSKLLLTFIILDGADGDGYVSTDNFEEVVRMMLEVKAYLTGEEINPREMAEIVNVFMKDVDENNDNKISFAEFYNHYSNRKENEFFDLLYGKGIDLQSSNNSTSQEAIYLKKLIDINMELNDIFYISEKLVDPNFKPFTLKVVRNNIPGSKAKVYESFLSRFTKLKGTVVDSVLQTLRKKRTLAAARTNEITINEVKNVMKNPEIKINTKEDAIQEIHRLLSEMSKRFVNIIKEAREILNVEDDEDPYARKATLSITIRERNKSKNEEKSSKTNKMGQLVRYVDSESFNLVLGIMLGVERAIKATANSGATTNITSGYKVEISIFEYTLPINQGIDPSGKKLESIKCRILDYAPKLFYKIRDMDNINNKDYLNSIRPISFITALLGGEWRTLAELCSPGKSGSFLYFTFDGMYLLKAIMKKEYLFFKKTLVPYYLHLKTNPDSLLARYYGLYELTMDNNGKVATYYLVIMNNIFNTPNELHYRLDLKGSTHGRHKFFKDAKKAEGVKMPSDDEVKKAILKCNDLRYMREQKILDITIPEDRKKKIHALIRADSNFLKEIDVIDYSLLVGVHEKKKSEKTALPMGVQNHIVESTDGTIIYYFGIIDTFIEFVFKKKMEYTFRSCAQGKGVSCVPPSQYSTRFIQFLENSIE